MDLTRVTVLMPCKDPHPGFFKEALQSVIDQTTKNWRLIIINDHSSEPATYDIFEKISGLGDERIRIIQNSSKFITGALNTGMRHADTLYVCSFHCDDVLAPNAVEILNRYITTFPLVQYFHSAWQVINEKGQLISNIINAKSGFKASDFQYGGHVKHLHCWSVAAALSIGGIDEMLGPHGADDYDFPWCMAEAGYLFKAIPECLYYYRDHREHYRLTTHVPLNVQRNELKKIFKKHRMNWFEIFVQLHRRTFSHLKQALFQNENDRKRKEKSGFDPRTGWKFRY